MIPRATLTPAELDVLLDVLEGGGLQLVEAARLPVFQLDAGAPKLVGWRTAARLIRERFGDQPDEVERRLADLHALRGGHAAPDKAAPDQTAIVRQRQLFDANTAIDLLRRAAAEKAGEGRWLKARLFNEWTARNGSAVTSTMIRNLFGTWTEALEAAELPAPDSKARRAAREERLERAIADVRRAAEETGESPLTGPTYDRWAKENGAESKHTLCSLLGGYWSPVLIRAGLPTKRLKWRGGEEQAVERLVRAAADLGVERLTQKAYTGWLERNTGPSLTQVRDRFGSWDEALSRAGLEAAWGRKQLPTFLPIDGVDGAE